MGQELLRHHRETCAGIATPPELLSDSQVKQLCLRYGTLCERIGAPFLTRSSGGFLHDIAEWCDGEKWPPLNALVVNAAGIPGEGYDRAPGGGFAEWPKQVRAAIVFKGYPDQLHG